MSDTFCPLPWMHLATHPEGKVTLCCVSDHTNNMSVAKNNGFEPIKENTMIQDTEKTNVEFYYHEENDDLFAYLSDEVADAGGNRMSYAHIGQHGSCCSEYVKECRKATEEEYKDLKTELESIGYNLNII